MINLETTEDVKLLKEMIDVLGLGNNSAVNVDVEELMRWVKTKTEALEIRVGALEKENHDLGLAYKVVQGRLDNLEKEREQILTRISELENNSVVKKINKNITTPKKRKPLKKDDNFIPYDKDMNEYHLLFLNGAQISHVFINRGAEREVNLPIDVFELLAIVEKYKKNGNSLKVREVDDFCKTFGLNKSQFSKIFYNMTIGKFDGVLAEINKMIGDSVFTFKKSHIYRNDHDTNMDKDTLNELVSIYANDPYPFSAANKIIKEKEDIDPFDLFITLKQSSAIYKIIGVEAWG